jgi:6-pyruvoyltetrahydropterin/6-carboxytetrahydropterin synthase
MVDRFRVHVTKDHFVFSAGHFLTYGDNICERLHGHNYRVDVEVEGPLGEHGYVVDFIALRDAIQAIVAHLDHRMLLPRSHPTIRVVEVDQEVIVRFEDRRWVFPTGDCLILPLANTTTELLAAWIADRLMEQFPAMHAEGITTLRVSVDENHGQWATCERHMQRSQ